jgi:hypothetical protein
MIAPDAATDPGVRPPRTWLAVMGAATTLGSEPMVGMQWVERLRARGEVTVLTTEIFRNPKFLPAEHWSEMVFIDTRATDEADYAGNFGRHLWRWWLGVRAHLKAHAQPGDRLLITAPAAIWMLPWLGGLPIPRERVFFGPLGVDWIPRSIRGSRWPGTRNLRTAAALLAWRVLGRWLPRDLALRAPMAGFERAMGVRFRLLGVLPEVEAPPMVFHKSAPSPRAVALLYDSRPRKRFEPSFALALKLAADKNLPVMLVGAPEALAAALAAKAGAARVQLQLLPRLDRAGFQAWLAETVPDFVSLSVSEGVPSTLIEALLAGCRLHVHDVGGIHWLVRCGIDASSELFGQAHVVSFRWDSRSLASYAADTTAMFDSLLEKLQLDLPAVAPT